MTMARIKTNLGIGFQATNLEGTLSIFDDSVGERIFGRVPVDRRYWGGLSRDCVYDVPCLRMIDLKALALTLTATRGADILTGARYVSAVPAPTKTRDLSRISIGESPLAHPVVSIPDCNHRIAAAHSNIFASWAECNA